MDNEIIENLPENKYRSITPHISVSQVKSFKSSESPWHFFKRNLCPDRPKVFNPAFIIGTLLHSRVELGKDFENKHVLVPKGITRGGPSWRKLLAENPGKSLVRPADWDLSLAMYESILHHPGACELLKDGEHEESFFGEYQGSNGPIKIKGRSDFRSPKKKFILDVKTTGCGCPHDNYVSYFGQNSFKKAVINGKLHWQAAFYLHLAKQLTGDDYDFIFLAVEKTYPFDVSLHVLSPSLLQRGKEEVFEALEELDKRIKNNDWPKYGNRIFTVEDIK